MRTAKHLLRSFLIVVSALLLTMSVTPPVSAHPGSTNADGGHMNRSTGEYHYHHGYSQHNHEDKNGDGVLDCPYEFDDQTDHSYHGDSDSVEYDYDYDYDYDWDVGLDYNLDYSLDIPAIVDEPEPTPVPKEDDENMPLPIWAKWVLFLLAAGLIICFLVALYYKKETNHLRSTLRETREKHSKQQEEFSSMVYNDLTELNQLLISTYGKSFLPLACGMPIGENITNDNLPCIDDLPSLKWGTKYTFYFNYKSGSVLSSGHRRLHTPSCRYAKGATPVNAYEVKRKENIYIPCLICHPTLPDMEWVDNYIKYKDIFTKHYNIDQNQKSSNKR